MKYYARIGRRFVQVKSVKGMFYNNDGTFSEKRTDKSIGICVHDDFEETIIASLGMSRDEVTYDTAEFVCKAAFSLGKGHIPTSYELLMLKNINYFKLYYRCSLWVSDYCHNNLDAYYLHFVGGYYNIYYGNKHYVSNKHKVIPFLTLKK